MKKIFALLLTLAIALSLFAVNVSAEAENFAKDLKWTGAATDITEKDGVLTASGIKNKWFSPYLDILPAIKKALGDEEEVSVEISFETRATFTAGNEGSSFSTRVIMRGVNGLTLNPADDPDAWNEAYAEAIDGEDPIFVSDTGGNVMYPIGKTDFNDEDWTEFSTVLELTATQINSTALTKWNLCVDEMSVTGIIDTIQFRNVKVAVYEEPDPTPTPEPTPTPTPKPTAKPADKPADGAENKNEGSEGTSATPNSNVLPTPDLNGNELGMVIKVESTPEGPVVTGLSLVVCILALAGTFIVGAGAGLAVGLVIGKKKSKKAE